MQISKSELRRTLRRKRDAFVEQIDAGQRALCFSCPPSALASLFEGCPLVAGYLPIGSEADPRRLMHAAAQAGCALALPYVLSKAQPMQFLPYIDGDELAEGPFGLKQPCKVTAAIAPDLVLVPLVGFDRQGNRLGQGAGHYDRALSLLPNAIRIGVAWSAQEVTALPADPWDEPLHAICTEKEWIII